MYGEYGYMEEGKLGRIYDLKLFLRLARYIVPYRKLVLFALCLTMLITVADLSVPYLSKIAIDRYIVSSWYRVQLQDLTETQAQEILDRYGNLFVISEDSSIYFIFQGDMGYIDPRDIHIYRQKGIINTHEKYYRITAKKDMDPELTGLNLPAVGASDGSIFISYKYLEGIPVKDILNIRSADLRGIAVVGGSLLVLVVFSFFLGYGEHYILELIGQRIMQDIRVRLFERMQAKRGAFFDRNPIGRLVTRVTNDVENLNEMFKSVIITVCKDIFILTGILAVLVYLNWRLAVICFVFMPVIAFVTFLFSSMSREVFRELRTAVARINSFLQERLTGMHVVQMFVTEHYQMNIFKSINRENYLAGMRQVRIFGVFMPIMELLSSAAIALIIWHGGGKVLGESLSLGSLVAFISYMQMFFKPIRDIAEKYNIMQAAMASTERIFEFMDKDEEISPPPNPYFPAEFKGHITFRDVKFSYRKEQNVLSGVSFEIRPGEKVAVVGPTGSGKTTIINLLERFYDPDEGAILLDGVDIRQWDQNELHRRIGFVMQDVFIFSGTVRENISLGLADPSATEESARIANAKNFIDRLPAKMDEVMGEAGATLSAGQRQLLSFARALAKRPGILILDEATSSVDPETERLIQDAIARMTAKRTTLVVAHRLSTIIDSDRIMVIHRGRIAEQGTHEELIRLGGIYQKLHRLQSRS